MFLITLIAIANQTFADTSWNPNNTLPSKMQNNAFFPHFLVNYQLIK
jgi:hypothetical protein